VIAATRIAHRHVAPPRAVHLSAPPVSGIAGVPKAASITVITSAPTAPA
jgi:hypothetical protein